MRVYAVKLWRNRPNFRLELRWGLLLYCEIIVWLWSGRGAWGVAVASGGFSTRFKRTGMTKFQNCSTIYPTNITSWDRQILSVQQSASSALKRLLSSAFYSFYKSTKSSSAIVLYCRLCKCDENVGGKWKQICLFQIILETRSYGGSICRRN